jgi:hypothetical protein
MDHLLEQISGGPPGLDIRTGIVTVTPTAATVTVSVNGEELDLPYLESYTPAVNDSVLVLTRGQRWVVVGNYTNPAAPVTPATPAAPPSTPTPTKPKPPTPKKTTFVRTFLANSTGCFRGGKWRTDTSNQPHQGDWGGYGINTGAWFYGSQIKAALAGATVLKVEMYLVRIGGGQYGGITPTIWTHPHQSRPGGAPSLLSSSTVSGLAVNTKRWVGLPLSFGTALQAGTAYGTACFVAGADPYAAFANLSGARTSGALRITYSK